MKARALPALAAAACLALCGCGPSANFKYRIAVIPKGLTHEHWQSVHRGADRAASDLKEKGVAVEIIWDGPVKEDDTIEQINLMKLKTGKGVNGLVLAPQDSKQLVKPVEQVVARGVPVVVIDSGLDKDALKENPDLIVKYVATDNYHGGQIAAQHLLELCAADGNTAPRIVLFRYQRGSESTEQREQGFIDAINAAIEKQRKDGVKPEITWDDGEYYAGATVNTAADEAARLLKDLKDDHAALFAVNESATAGMLNAMKPAKAWKKYRFVGFDASDQLRAALRDDAVNGLVMQDPYRMGYLGVWTLVQHLEGYDVAADGKYLGTGEIFVTAKDLDDPKTRGLFDPDEQQKRDLSPPEFKKKR